MSASAAVATILLSHGGLSMSWLAQQVVIERIAQASAPDDVIEIFDKALMEVGAEYNAITFLPCWDDRIDKRYAWRGKSRQNGAPFTLAKIFVNETLRYVIADTRLCPSIGLLHLTILRRKRGGGKFWRWVETSTFIRGS